MDAKIVTYVQDSITIAIKVQLQGKSMLEAEEEIQKALNEGGMLLTCEALKRFDTDGSPIRLGNTKFTSKGLVPKAYQTPYGEVLVERHVYQDSQGGKGYCPLDHNARVVTTSTPRFAKMVAYKYADGGSFKVADDLKISNEREVARSYIQNVAEAVGSVAALKEEKWEYELPEMDKAVKTITVGLDGTCMLMLDEGYREAMAGTLGFYDRDGERMHTIYIGAGPEHGKEKFYTKMEAEIARVKESYSDANYIGLADGDKGNWKFLNRHTDEQILDFWHASEYLTKAADAIYNDKKQANKRKEWLDEKCHNLKHKIGAATRILHELETLYPRLKGEEKENLASVITYFRNQKGRMRYAQNIEKNIPIGSGVTEAACKVVVKQRLCQSGMKWKEKGTSIVLSLRCLRLTNGRWEQFWDKIDKTGLPMVA